MGEVCNCGGLVSAAHTSLASARGGLGISVRALALVCPWSTRIAQMGATTRDVHSERTVREPSCIKIFSSITAPSVHFVPRPHGRNAKFARRTLSCQGFSSNSPDSDFEKDIWLRVQLLDRLLEVSIREENYSEAKRIHDQLIELKARLTEGEQLLLEKVTFLRKGSSDKRIEVIADLGDLADKRVLPMLADGLLDSNPLVALEAEKAMWKIFMQSGREDVDQRLQEGIALMLLQNMTAARDVFTKVIEMDPLFAEGWNKRATINFLLQEYWASIQDCKQALELNPYHFGALSGMGLCHAAINDLDSALFWFEKAYAMHPSLGQINKYIEALKQKLADGRKELENKDEENQL